MHFGLRFKFGVFLAAFGILASGLTGYYFYSASRTLLVRVAESDLSTASQVLGRGFSTTLDEVARDVRFLAALPEAVQALASKPGGEGEAGQRLAESFAAMLAVHPEYFQLRLIAADQHGLERVRLDRDGRGVTRVTGADLQEKGHYPYVFRTLRQGPGEIHVSRIAINHEAGAHAGQERPTLRLATPVSSQGGRNLGLVVVNVDLEGVFRLLQADLPSSYQLYLANEWGDFLIHPDAGLAFGFDRGRRYLLPDSFPQAGRLFEDRGRHTVVTSTEPDQGEGKGLVAAFHRLPFGETADGRFVVLGLSQSLDRVLGETRALAIRTIQFVVLFSLLAVLLSWLVSRLTTRPLNMIVEAVKGFSREHAVGELPLSRKDEFGLLAHTFNDMQIEIKAHLAQLDENRRQLDHLARHDPLTGLANRMQMFETLEHEMAAMRRAGRRLALFFIDLDRFKEINDSLGHAVGDEVLRVSARRLKGLVREVDTVARLGGDEFMLLLSGLDEVKHLSAIADKVIHALEQPIPAGELSLSVSASLGVALYPGDATTAADLVQKADLAMYQAKAAGRHAWRFHSSPGEGPAPGG